MKKALLTLLFLLTLGLSPALRAENSSDLGTIKTNAEDKSYVQDRETTNQWKVTNSAILKFTENGLNYYYPVLNGKTTAFGTITSPVLEGGVQTISVRCFYPYSETNGIKFTLTIKDKDGKTLKSQDLSMAATGMTTGTSTVAYVLTSDNFDIEGDFIIELKNGCPSNSTSNKDRLGVISITWSSYGEIVTPPVKKEDAGLAFDKDTYETNIGEDFTSPILTNPNDLPITYTSSNESVASVDDNGIVNIIAAGTTTIKAVFEGNDNFFYGDASYTLSVTDPNAPTVTFDFINKNYGMTRYSGNSGNYNPIPITISDGKAIITFDGGNNRLWSDGVRLYTNAYALISVENGYSIKSVSYTSTSASSFEQNTLEDGTVKISLKSNNNGKPISTIKVEWEELSDDYVAAPSISNDLGVVTIEANDGLTVYYTTDGSDPKEDGAPVYGESFTVANGTTVKAVAKSEAGNYSNVVEKEISWLSVTSIAALVELNNTKDEISLDFPMTVIYQNTEKTNTYVTDGKDFILLYKVTETYENGDVIPAGAKGKFTVYNGLNEVQNLTNLGAATIGTPVEPEVVTVDAISSDIQNHFVRINKATIESYSGKDNKDSEISDATGSVTAYDTFVLGLTGYGNYTGFVGVYKDAPQFIPVAFEEIPEHASINEASGIITLKNPISGDDVLSFLVDGEDAGNVTGNININEHEAFKAGHVHAVTPVLNNAPGKTFYVLTKAKLVAKDVNGEDGKFSHSLVTFEKADNVRIFYVYSSSSNTEDTTPDVAIERSRRIVAENDVQAIAKDKLGTDNPTEYTGEFQSDGTPINYVAIAEDPANEGKLLTSAVAEDISTGLAEIFGDEEGTTKVFDLNGREVNGELEEGIYIFVKGKKAVKVAVK